MSDEKAAETVAWIKRVGAWDCCATCAGGVLAERDRDVAEGALRGRLVIDPDDFGTSQRLADALCEAMCKSDVAWDEARSFEVHAHMRTALNTYRERGQG